LNPANELKAWQQKAQAQTELLLERFLPSENQVPHTLHEAMRYVTLGGGKRLRPLLVLAASELGEANQNAVEQAMAAIEMVHVYSLVHDDMPAMDNDSLRRGKPTCHVKYDEATALLVGDALQTQAFDVLSRPTGLPAERQIAMLSTLAKASGSLGMAARAPPHPAPRAGQGGRGRGRSGSHDPGLPAVPGGVPARGTDSADAGGLGEPVAPG